MRITLIIAILFFTVAGMSQRPDLIIGAHMDQQMLYEPVLSQSYYIPGIALDMEVSKNRFAGQLSLGMKGAEPSRKAENPTQFTKYFLNLDLSFGVFLIKRPAFKCRFNVGASNMFNLNKYRPESAFNIPGYSLQAYPEFHFRYKYYVASVYYSLPVVGFDSRGTGLKIGIGF